TGARTGCRTLLGPGPGLPVAGCGSRVERRPAGAPGTLPARRRLPSRPGPDVPDPQDRGRLRRGVEPAALAVLHGLAPPLPAPALTKLPSPLREGREAVL